MNPDIMMFITLRIEVIFILYSDFVFLIDSVSFIFQIEFLQVSCFGEINE